MGELSTNAALVMTQITSYTRCDFEIYSIEGTPIGAVTTDGGALARMFTGPRHLTVTDSDGSPFVLVHDHPNLGRDRFELAAPDGALLATVTKELTFLRKRLTVAVAGGPSFEMNERDLMDREFDLDGARGRIATVRRDWPGTLQGLLGRSRYVLAFTDGADDTERRLALGAVLAVELIRLKARNSDGGAAAV